jgi:hypothetical protein
MSGNGINPTQVAQYVNNMIGPGQNIVEVIQDDGSIVKKKAEDVFPKDEKGNVKSIVNADISATIVPGMNKILVSVKNGESFLVNPDLATQSRIAPLAELFNGANKINNTKMNGMDLFSYNSFDGNYNISRDLFVKASETSDPKEVASLVASKFGMRSADPKFFDQMANNEVYVASRDKNTGRLQYQKYSHYNKNKEGYNDRMMDKREKMFFMKKDGKFIGLLTDPRLNAEALTNETVQGLFDPTAQGPLSGLRDSQSLINNRKFQEWQMQENQYYGQPMQ